MPGQGTGLQLLNEKNMASKSEHVDNGRGKKGKRKIISRDESSDESNSESDFSYDSEELDSNDTDQSPSEPVEVSTADSTRNESRMGLNLS